MTKQAPAQMRRQIDRLTRLLDAERERAEKAWSGYRTALYELVALRMKVEEIGAVLNRKDEE